MFSGKGFQRILSVAVLLAALPFCFATSTGAGIGVCDVDGNYGCRSWAFKPGTQEVDQLKCNDVPEPIMWWASKPKHTSLYRLYVGTDLDAPNPISYEPGQWMEITIEVTEKYKQYRGLLMYAEDKDGKKVGEWSVLGAHPKLWLPWPADHACARAVMHNDAELMPYKMTHRVRFPEGTGKVTFRALLKSGVANTGAFWFPNQDGDLSLEEGKKPDPKPRFIMAPKGTSCEDHCQKLYKLPCNADLSSKMSEGIDNFEKNIKAHYSCDTVSMVACNPEAPTRNLAGDTCYFRAPGCSQKFSCDRPSTKFDRFCVCGDTGIVEDPEVVAPTGSKKQPLGSGSSTDSESEGQEGSESDEEASACSWALCGTLFGLFGLLMVAMAVGIVVLIAKFMRNRNRNNPVNPQYEMRTGGVTTNNQLYNNNNPGQAMY